MASTSIETPKRFITSDELAEMLAIKKQTINLWRIRGKGPPFCRVGSAVRYDIAAIEEWIKSHTGNSTTELNARGA